jgi:hypothetical protein
VHRAGRVDPLFLEDYPSHRNAPAPGTLPTLGWCGRRSATCPPLVIPPSRPAPWPVLPRRQRSLLLHPRNTSHVPQAVESWECKARARWFPGNCSVCAAWSLIVTPSDNSRVAATASLSFTLDVHFAVRVVPVIGNTQDSSALEPHHACLVQAMRSACPRIASSPLLTDRRYTAHWRGHPRALALAKAVKVFTPAAFGSL